MAVTASPLVTRTVAGSDSAAATGRSNLGETSSDISRLASMGGNAASDSIATARVSADSTHAALTVRGRQVAADFVIAIDEFLIRGIEILRPPSWELADVVSNTPI